MSDSRQRFGSLEMLVEVDLPLRKPNRTVHGPDEGLVCSAEVRRHSCEYPPALGFARKFRYLERLLQTLRVGRAQESD